MATPNSPCVGYILRNKSSPTGRNATRSWFRSARPVSARVNGAATVVVLAIFSGDRFALRSVIAGTAGSVPARTILPLVSGNAPALLAIVRAMIVGPSRRDLAATVAVFASLTHVALLLR
jgi:hypothetical protein